MGEEKGYIYILTNPAFPQFVKIGYAKDVDERLRQLNQSEGVPLAFRVYATYEVSKSLMDKQMHRIIDKLNPSLRSKDEINGKLRVREFFAMTASDAFSIFEAMAEIHGCEDKLVRRMQTDEERELEVISQEIDEERKARAAAFSFDMCNIPVGAELEFWRTATQPTEHRCKVTGTRRVEFDGEQYSLSSLAAKLLNVSYSVHGPCYFKFNGEWLNDIRDRLGV